MEQNHVIRLKLLIDTKGQRVLFGEVDKTIVDFLFHLLSFPLGSVCELLKGQNMVGCLGNLYRSVETLNQNYLQPNSNIQTFLEPKVISCGNTSVGLPYTSDPSPLPKFYVCNSDYSYSCRFYVSNDPKALCSNCGLHMSREITCVKPISYCEDLGYVKDLVTYIVMDDLSIMPMSSIPTITLLKKFNIKEMAALEEKLITFNFNEVIYII